MLISVATANYFHLPFEQTLEIIVQSGVQFIELDLFWERNHWAMAQHLRGYPPREVLRMIERAGLKIASIHDGGGVLEDPFSTRGFINPQLPEYLDQLGSAPDCLVFHTPHIEGNLDNAWWSVFSDQVIAALEPYRAACQIITIENMPFFDGYTVPLTNPKQLLAFAQEAELAVTLDTTHYAQIGVDIVQAAKTLNSKVKTIHLSDYLGGKAHVFPGDGELDLRGFFHALDSSALHSITLECAPTHLGEIDSGLTTTTLSERLSTARDRVAQWLAEADQE